jgi:glycosyltransferase involved in cell wall biosynthesis
MSNSNLEPNKVPFFSVIIPTYNRATKITTTIQSVINQQFKDWELIIIDDGSTDNTAEVIAKIDDPRIKYFFQKNSERSISRNNGFQKSRGKFICFLDSDDLYCENHLKEMFDFICSHHEEKALYFTNQLINDGTGLKEMPATVFTNANSLEYILVNSIMPVRVCIHRDILNEYKFNPNYIVVEDTILWAEITNVYPMIHLNKSTVIYSVHDDNSVNMKFNAYQVRLNGLRYLFKSEKIKNRITKRIQNQAVSICYYGIARHFEYKKKFFPMLYNSIMSILFDLKSPQNKAKLYMIYSYFKSK